MNKLSESLKGLKEKFKEMTKAKKIALAILTLVIVITLITITVVALKPNYVVLFSNMTADDSGAIIQNLQDKKVKYKVEGNSILVEKEGVDKLRMELLSEVSLKEGSHGFELFDESKTIGATDSESKILYQRALSGELERTIKSFNEIDNAKVNLVIPDKSAFVTKPTPATASVTVLLKKGKELSEDQVRAIVSLISGSVENLPKENVTVVTDNFKLLTEGLFDKNKTNLAKSTDKQIMIKKEVEEEYRKKVINVLEPIYKNKVRVSVNADLNFDAIEKNDVKYDKEGAVVSKHETETTDTTTENTSGSPIDNNMNNTENDKDKKNNGTVHKESTTNYDVSKSEETIVKAPGAVQRLSASVVIDGNVDNQTKTSIRNLVAEAIGASKQRGDAITVEGIQFDTQAKDIAEKELNDMKKAEAKAKMNKIISMAVFGVAALVILVIILSAIKKSKKQDTLEDVDEITNFDMMIGDDTEFNEKRNKFEDLELGAESERDHIISEVQKYASNKPEQVVDIVKAWLAEEEGR